MSSLSERLLEHLNEPRIKAGYKWCSGIVGIIIIVTILILTNISTLPNCSMLVFDVSALNNDDLSANNNSTIKYDLELNLYSRLDNGIYYDALNVSFYYKPNVSSLIGLGTITFPAFYQEGNEMDHFTGKVDTTGVDFEDAARSAVTANGSAVFKVNLSTRVRYGYLFWKSKRHHYAVGADLHVDGQGKLIKGNKDKGIVLTSGAGAITVNKNGGSLHL